MIRKLQILIVLAIFLTVGCVSVPISPDKRPSYWAKPVPAKHLTNFYKLDDRLYRSAQPDINGMIEAQSFGIHTIIDLQERPHQDPISSATQHMLFYRVPQYAWNVDEENVVHFLWLIKHIKGPFLVHCLHGSDRTGLNCAMYRIVIQGWPKEEAVNELKHGGYGFHWIWMNIPDYIENVDVDRIKILILLQDVIFPTCIEGRKM